MLDYEDDVESNESTYWLIFELLWRDYFRFIAMQHGDRIWHETGLKDARNPVTHHPLQWKDWCTGNTKSAYVNANMHELRLTGFMSNRGRQNVASYAIHDMGLDWRACAAWFERWLIDFDPCSNTGNWLYVAGIGNDPRPQRKFDVDWQAERYDPDGGVPATLEPAGREISVRSRRRVMMYWNVTYNDPNRWKAVYEASGGRLPWWRGVRETFAGLPVGPPSWT